MSKPSRGSTPSFRHPDIRSVRSPDGRVVLSSADPLREYPTSVIHDFRRISEAHPDRDLVVERSSADGWTHSTWGEVRAQVDGLAQGLIDRGLTDRPVMILSANSTLHLVVTSAAMTVGAPVVPVSVAYSLLSSDHAHLRAIAEVAEPGLVVAEGADYAAAVKAIAPDAQLLGDASLPGALDLNSFQADPGAEVDQRAKQLTADTVAKILFTSGSTGSPKGVKNTHGMLSANQQQMRQVWPFLADEPPVLLDWLPWSHTFGGNHNVNMVLSNGGTLWIDDGRPSPQLIHRTVRNLVDVEPTLFFNVPAGYAALVPLLEQDATAAAAFFRRLRLGFFAAAALPQQLWDRIIRLASEHGSTMQMTTSWGLTESSPAATSAHFPITRSDILGVPLPGMEAALLPVDDKYEIRLRGPNITPGYHRRPDLASVAFDDDGWFRTGDAVELVDDNNPSAGLAFRGRLSENFKLNTGTFVTVGTLRPKLLSASDGLLADAVVCGENRDCVTALVWLSEDHAHRYRQVGDLPSDLRAELVATLGRLASESSGSSQRVERLMILVEPPSLDAGEITDKGYVNQRAVRSLRAAEEKLLYVDPLPPQVVCLASGSSRALFTSV